MARTQRFGLETFGGDVDGALGDKGGKFTRGDRLLIDRVLSALEAHSHSGGSRLADPSAAPALTLDTANGILDANTYYYTVTYVDQFGLETAMSTEASVTTASAVSRPQGPGLVAEAGGTLDEGLYTYALSAHKGGGETTLSTMATITLTDLNTVRVSIPGGLPVGADSISIWRQGPTETWFTRVHTQADASDWLDDGSVAADPNACEPANQPQTENTTGASSQVTIEAPTGDLVQPTLATRWRIYRTTTSGVYGPKSLLADVADTTTDGGVQLVESFVDDGSVALSWGSPPLESQTLIPSPTVTGGGGAGGGGVILRDASDGLWRLVCDREGRIVTRAIPSVTGVDASLFGDLGVSLDDSNGTSWRVTVGTDGAVATAIGSVAGEPDYTYARGPDLPTFDGAVSYRLSISTTGVLTTLGEYDGSAVEGFGVTKLHVGPTPPPNPENGTVWLDTTGLS